MGVVYTGNYGIGVKVSLGETYNEDEDDISEVLSDITTNEPYTYFEVGDYDTKKDYYVGIDKPFEYGYDITQKRNELLHFLKENDIDYEGELDVVGGVNGW